VAALTVLYDGACPLCERCRDWLARSPQIVALDLVDCRSPDARRRFGRVPGLGAELVVVDARGRYWVGPAAFVMCLWALRGWRAVASLLVLAPLLPLTIAAFTWLSHHRGALGRFFGGPACSAGHCGTPHLRTAGPYR
jgi:predicted DCC family thiol-disulfide oxidoreductase YuxK